MVPVVLSVAVPLAARWVKEQESVILQSGVPLTNHQAFDAHLAGVKEPGRVRVMRVDFIPTPTHPVLRQANEVVGLVSPVTAGITFGYGIYIRSDMWEDRRLLVHELVHVGQDERYRSIEGFLRDYLQECLSTGYPDGPLEQEAVTRAEEICS
jgi:hypothetical protein